MADGETDPAALRARLEGAIEDLDLAIERRRMDLAGRVADVAREAHEVLGIGAGGAAEMAEAAGLGWGRFFMMIGLAGDNGDQAAQLFLRRWADAGRRLSLKREPANTEMTATRERVLTAAPVPRTYCVPVSTAAVMETVTTITTAFHT